MLDATLPRWCSVCPGQFVECFRPHDARVWHRTAAAVREGMSGPAIDWSHANEKNTQYRVLTSEHCPSDSVKLASATRFFDRL